MLLKIKQKINFPEAETVLLILKIFIFIFLNRDYYHCMCL